MSDRLGQGSAVPHDLPVFLDRIAAEPRTREVADFIRAYIRQHGLRAGEVLPGETEISRLLGVSRPSVREATNRLAALGLIMVAPGRRPRVGVLQGGVLSRVLEAAVMTRQANVLDLLGLRRGLEIEIAGLAAEARGGPNARELAATAAAMNDALMRRTEYAALDLRFHDLLARATPNPLFALLIGDIQQAILHVITVGLRSRAGRVELRRVQAVHTAVLDAVLAGDKAAARDAIGRHFDEAEAAVRRRMAADHDQDGDRT